MFVLKATALVSCLLIAFVQAIPTKVSDDSPVNLGVYYETLCPDSIEFINGQLWNAFQTIPSIMNVTLVPYGNANETYRNETGMYQWACQHRVNECWGNLFETCLIHYYPDFADHFPVVHCMELNTTDIHAIASSCSASFNVTGDVVSKCMMTKMGNQLQHQMAVQTRSLNPPHTYVPWVTVNGVHTEDIQQAAQDDLVALICKTYQGSSKPDACN